MAILLMEVRRVGSRKSSLLVKPFTGRRSSAKRAAETYAYQVLRELGRLDFGEVRENDFILHDLTRRPSAKRLARNIIAGAKSRRK